MTELQCRFFAVNIFLLQIFVNAAEVIAADGLQVRTHKDGASSGTGGLKPDSRNVISPRMDFDEWTPLGRGDPLKNDPTFDYLPPVLDKVHYWKSPPPPPSPPSSNRAQYPSTVASSSSHAVVNYNRRFFLTDFSKKEPAVYAQYTHKRPQIVSVAAGGYHYPVPKTPLPMLTPPPYQRPTTLLQQYTTSTVVPTDVSSFSDAAGNSAAESKQPPTVRAPPPPPPPPPMSSTRHTMSAPQVSSVRPVLSHSIIKVLLENEVDRTTVTTTAASTTTSTTSTGTSTTRVPPTTDPLFAHYKQSTVTGRPMYLIIQGHSKVKTYGLHSKPDDLSSAADHSTPAAAVHEHNHIENRPDEPNRRKRNGRQR